MKVHPVFEKDKNIRILMASIVVQLITEDHESFIKFLLPIDMS